jgi:hypothetical protein
MKKSASAPKHVKPTLNPDQAKALEFLRKFLRKGTTIYTVLRHVSSSGTCRFIDLYVVKQNTPMRITWSAAVMLEWTYSRPREALGDIILGDGNALNQRWL